MESLKCLAQEIIETSSDYNPTFNNLNEFQREKLTAQIMREMGKKAYETVEEISTSQKLSNKIIEALSEEHIADKAVLCKEIGEMLLEGAISGCKHAISEALNEAYTQLSAARHFPEMICGVSTEVIKNDIVARVRDMNSQRSF